MARAGESGKGGSARYAVFGCGSTGYHVAQELAARGENVVVCDIDESRVRELRDQRFDAVQGDISDAGFLAGLPAIEVAFVLSGNNEVNTAAVRALRKAFPNIHIVARATDPLGAGLLGSAGADLVLYPSRWLRGPPSTRWTRSMSAASHGSFTTSSPGGRGHWGSSPTTTPIRMP